MKILTTPTNARCCDCGHAPFFLSEPDYDSHMVRVACINKRCVRFDQIFEMPLQVIECRPIEGTTP